MKILTPPDPFEPIELDCPSCGAELEADKIEDFFRVSGGDMRESWDYAICKCPCCSAKITVDKDEFPEYIYNKLKVGYTENECP